MRRRAAPTPSSRRPDPRAEAALDETVEHVPDFAREPEAKPEPPVSVAPVEEVVEEVTAEAAASRAAARYFQTMLEPAPQLHRVPPPKGAAYIAAIRVVGVGGAGLNAIHRMMDAGIAQVDFVAVNTDRAGARDLGRADRRSRSARGSRTGSAPAPIRVSGAPRPRRRSTS